VTAFAQFTLNFFLWHRNFFLNSWRHHT